ncbi:MAG: hypothetical protein IKP88_12590 [Lachnospiraceae bacterium]|nr:hypothetical protein [Lachnospiraceae bacterium]
MTDEEARAEAEEARMLLAEIDRLNNLIERALIIQENLKEELETLISNINVLTDNARAMDSDVNKSMEHVKKRVADADLGTTELFNLIDELTGSYFSFKNLSTASKNLTQFNDEYYTKYRFFNELRRITLGFVVGLDVHVCSDETMRKKVEAVYLKNTDYWLAYAIMAVMLWASNEEEAAKRALSKSIIMDYYNSSIFFLLINLRFTRVDVAKKWYLSYLDRVDMENLGKEWQYLLQAYLSGVFGVDEEFNSLVHKYLTGYLEQMEAMHPNYGNMLISRTLDFSKAYIHVTENEFESLRRYCPQYKELKALLSAAEKNTVLAIHFREVFEADNEIESNIFQRIENILYDLINSYDKEELKLIKKKRYNEMVVKAKGDLGLAQQYYNNEYPEDVTTRSLDNLLYEWAFEQDSSQVDITVKKFALSYLKKWIAKGFTAYGEDYRKLEKESYSISIDGWTRECNENSVSEAEADLKQYYNKNRIMDTLNDKYVMIFLGISLGAIIMLVIIFFVFNKIALVIGILLGIVGGFLSWRRISDLQAILKTRRENACMKLKNALNELKAWREMYKAEDAKNIDLVNVFDDIDI